MFCNNVCVSPQACTSFAANCLTYCSERMEVPTWMEYLNDSQPEFQQGNQSRERKKIRDFKPVTTHRQR
jgi:hypothetical protein